MNTHPFSSDFIRARGALARVATHILARKQHAAIGKIGLQPAPRGFGTTRFGPDFERLRVSGPLLVHERTGTSLSARAIDIAGSSLQDLADLVEIDLTEPFSVGHDTPELGDPARPIGTIGDTTEAIGRWFSITAAALDDVLVLAEVDGLAPTAAQVWPEHFDLGLNLAFNPAALETNRVNLGGSLGDTFSQTPYIYVGPWTTDRPGGDPFWDAPFGATLGWAEVMGAVDPVNAATEFFADRLQRLCR